MRLSLALLALLALLASRVYALTPTITVSPTSTLTLTRTWTVTSTYTNSPVVSATVTPSITPTPSASPTASPTPGCGVLASNTLAFWSLNNTLADASPGNYTLAYAGTPFTFMLNNCSGLGTYQMGPNCTVQSPPAFNTAFSNQSQWTIQGYYYAAGTLPNQDIYLLETNSGTYSLYINGGGFFEASDGINAIISAFPVAPGECYDLGYTASGGVDTLYLNNALQGLASSTVSNTGTVNEFLLETSGGFLDSWRVSTVAYGSFPTTDGPACSPTISPTFSVTPTITQTLTPTRTYTFTVSPTVTITPFPTNVLTATATRTVTPTFTPTLRPEFTATVTPTYNAQEPTASPTIGFPFSSPTATMTPYPTVTAYPTPWWW